MTMNSNNRSPIEDLLRSVAGKPQPTQDQRAQALLALEQAIGLEPETVKAPRTRFPRRILVPVAAVVVFVVALLNLQAPSQNAVQATIQEIARAAEVIDPSEVLPQDFAFTRSQGSGIAAIGVGRIPNRDEPLYYRITIDRQEWMAVDGLVQLITTTHSPIFFSAEDEADYFRAGLDVDDNLGQTITEAFAPPPPEISLLVWSSDPDILESQIFELLGRRANDYEVLNHALDLIRGTPISPEVRSSVLTVVSRLDDVKLVSTGPEQSTFSLDYRNGGKFTYTFTLSSEGQLLGEKVIDLDGYDTLPSGTVRWENQMEPTIIVGDLTVP